MVQILLFSVLDIVAFAARLSFFYAGLNVACNGFKNTISLSTITPSAVLNRGGSFK
jgi:hypothetical protein